MSNIVAGIGRAQLEVLEDRVNSRRVVFDTYKKELSNIPGINFMPELEGTKSNRWLTTLTINPDIIKLTPYEIMDKMNEVNIETRALWKPLHAQPLFKEATFYKHNESKEAISDSLFAKGLCLPSGSNLKESEVEHVIEAFKKIVG